MPPMRGARRPTTRAGRTGLVKFRRMGAGFAGLRRRRRMYPYTNPTFTETFLAPANGGIIVGNQGGVFKVRISDIPQIADYQTLYRQYRINWVKVIVVPEFAGTSTDINTAYQNNAGALAVSGQARIVWVKNTTPAVANPANEGEVLEDNGCKIRTMGMQWAQSFKPVTDKYTGDALGGAGVAVREKFRGFLSFAQQAGNNPEHHGISYWISHNTPAGAIQTWRVYYKVNFSLRDPQ